MVSWYRGTLVVLTSGFSCTPLIMYRFVVRGALTSLRSFANYEKKSGDYR